MLILHLENTELLPSFSEKTYSSDRLKKKNFSQQAWDVQRRLVLFSSTPYPSSVLPSLLKSTESTAFLTGLGGLDWKSLFDLDKGRSFHSNVNDICWQPDYSVTWVWIFHFVDQLWLVHKTLHSTSASPNCP